MQWYGVVGGGDDGIAAVASQVADGDAALVQPAALSAVTPTERQ